MNNGFNKTERQFTYLVPTDKAWDNLKTGDFASAYKVKALDQGSIKRREILFYLTPKCSLVCKRLTKVKVIS